MVETARIIRSWRTGLTVAIATLLLSACIDHDTADWIITAHTVDAVAENGTIAPGRSYIPHGKTASFSLTPAENHILEQVTGCQGSLSGNTFTTGAITRDCTITAIFHIRSHWLT